ncbi:hypothetical protein [Streptomyces sp. Act143]|uniref:MmyB family transcriptional regulator n=1 Tax=Streptomyces sp. Act143 TaxID=2200760 RepID=UPI0015E8115C|nr:hypothetical protein [Streptomyces sp. Act143]
MRGRAAVPDQPGGRARHLAGRARWSGCGTHQDRAVNPRELVGELCALSGEFRTMRATHDVRTHHGGTQRIEHPEVGTPELAYQSMAPSR